MKWIGIALGIGLVGSVACKSGAATMPTPITPSAPATVAVASPAPTVESHPVPIERIGDALIQAAELPGGPLLWTQEDSDQGNIWGVGLCGNAAGPSPTSRFDRRFLQHRTDINGVKTDAGFVIESILVFAPGDAAQFMTVLRDSATACRSELQPSGRELFGARFPRVRHENQVYSVESFSCCVTPLPTDHDQPHDMVYIRDGDVILHIYGTADEAIEWAARHSEDHVDGVPSKDN